MHNNTVMAVVSTGMLVIAVIVMARKRRWLPTVRQLIRDRWAVAVGVGIPLASVLIALIVGRLNVISLVAAVVLG